MGEPSVTERRIVRNYIDKERVSVWHRRKNNRRDGHARTRFTSTVGDLCSKEPNSSVEEHCRHRSLGTGSSRRPDPPSNHFYRRWPINHLLVSPASFFFSLALSLASVDSEIARCQAARACSGFRQPAYRSPRCSWMSGTFGNWRAASSRGCSPSAYFPSLK